MSVIRVTTVEIVRSTTLVFETLVGTKNIKKFGILVR